MMPIEPSARSSAISMAIPPTVPRFLKICGLIFQGGCQKGCELGSHIKPAHLDEVRAQSIAKNTLGLCRFYYAEKCRNPVHRCPRLHIPLDQFEGSTEHGLANAAVAENHPMHPAPDTALSAGRPIVDTAYRPPHHCSRSNVTRKFVPRPSRAARTENTQQPPVMQKLSCIRGKVSDIHKIAVLWDKIGRHAKPHMEVPNPAAQFEKSILDKVEELSRYLDRCLQQLRTSPGGSPHGKSDSDASDSGEENNANSDENPIYDSSAYQRAGSCTNSTAAT